MAPKPLSKLRQRLGKGKAGKHEDEIVMTDPATTNGAPENEEPIAHPQGPYDTVGERAAPMHTDMCLR